MYLVDDIRFQHSPRLILVTSRPLDVHRDALDDGSSDDDASETEHDDEDTSSP